MSYSAPAYGLVWRATNSINTIAQSTTNAPSTGFANTSVLPSADLAVFVPVRVTRTSVVRRLFAAVVDNTGNIDVGLYSATGTRLVSSGKTAAASDFTADVTDTTIGPGCYYLAYVADNTTLTVVCYLRSAPLPTAVGVLTQQLGAGAALPATATFAITQALGYIPALAAITGTVIA